MITAHDALRQPNILRPQGYRTMSGNPALQAIIGFVAIIGALIFFSSVNLTQAQAVSSMFLCLGAIAGLWYWKKPWK